MSDYIGEFRMAMQSAGIETTADILPDGKLHRFHIEGDRPASENGWAVLFGDESPAGQFGCFKRGISETWTSSKESTLTDEQRARQAEKIRQARQLRDAEETRVRAECHQWCVDTWAKAKDANSDHAYLEAKGVQSYGLKLLCDSLLIPLRDIDGKIQGMQFIQPDGSKKFKTGTAKKGNYFAIGRPKDKTLLLCEGYATGASLHECTGHAVGVCFDAGNLKHVALVLLKKYPDFKLIICGDNDESGTGQKAAHEASLAVGGIVALPPATGQDWNDMHQQEGPAAVKKCIRAAELSLAEAKGKTDFSNRNLIEGSNPSLSSLSDSYPSPNPSPTLHLVKGFLIEEHGEKKKLAPQSKAAEKISEMIQGEYAFSMDASVWYRFDSTHWRMCNCSQVESEITELIYRGAGALGFSSAYPHGTMDLLRKSKAISLPVQNHRHIPFQNGLLEISTKQLIPIDPQNAMTWILPCDYLKEAQCPNFLQWLAASVENDHGTIRLLQAWINAVLMGRPELQRFLHLVGPAGTGKSTFLRLIFQLVGKDNFTTTSLKQLETNRFEAANIYEKRLVSIEEADKYGGSVSVLKSMTGQDPLRLERKNQQQQGSFIFDGQVLITSNERFATSDNSNGIERRRITVDFTHWITPEERAAWDRRGGEERILWPEIPGIINWSLQLSDAEVRASFQTMPNRIRKANLEAARVNNSVLDWMVNNLLPDETASNQVGDKREIKSYGTTHYENEETRLYPNYLFWTQCNGRKPVSTRSFTDVLLEQSRSYGITCRKVRKKDGTMIEGLKFRQDFEDSWLSRLDGEVKGEGWVKGQVKDKPLIMQEMKDKGTFPTSSYEKNISSIPPTKLDHSYEVF